MRHEYTRAEIERYLLGQGNDEERARLAAQLIEDAEFHQRVREVETDQVDQLARGFLKDEEAAVWREYLEQTGQMERLEIARALAAKVRPRRWIAGWMQVAAALLLTSGGAWWWMAKEKPPAPMVASVRVGIDLPRDNTRGVNREPEIRIAKEATEVELRFEVAAEPASGYRLVMRNGAGATVLVREGKGWPSGALAVVVPAASVPDGPLDLELSAVSGDGAANPVGFYRVRVSR